MDAYSVSETDTALLRLIDRAAAGETVLITRGGYAVAELRPAGPVETSIDATATLLAGLRGLPPSPMSSVELLRRVYEEE